MKAYVFPKCIFLEQNNNRESVTMDSVIRPISDVDKDRMSSELVARADDMIGWRRYRAGGKLAGLFG